MGILNPTFKFAAHFRVLRSAHTLPFGALHGAHPMLTSTVLEHLESGPPARGPASALCAGLEGRRTGDDEGFSTFDPQTAKLAPERPSPDQTILWL